MLIPGFSVREIPVRIPNSNNLRFNAEGELIALGYDGRVRVLRDNDGDGLPETARMFWDKQTLSVPVGMAWSPQGLFVTSKGKLSLLKDTDSDGVADVEEVLASGWPPTDVGSGGVDATAVTLDAEGNAYFGLLVADYSNPYRIKDGVSHYDINSPRGTIQKWSATTKRLETIATGVRVPYALAFNRAGDLFLTDQEGETWCPGGNPLDELNHIIPGKNYGFPPRHEKYLPNLASEAPVIGFGPQHQSTCGFVFNEPGPNQKLFGPKAWEGNAFVAGESRGKIWRAQLTKTSSGYVGAETLIARSDMLVTDVAISPDGDLFVCAHSGPPDWGTGPNGIGKIFKISYTDRAVAQAERIWVSSPMELNIAFDRAIDPSITNRISEMRIEFGEYVSAADRLEVLKPPYKVVAEQDAAPRGIFKVLSAKLSEDGRTLRLEAGPHSLAVRYALQMPGYDLAYDLKGAAWAVVPPARTHASQHVQIAGGDYERGRELFFGEKIRCATCHSIRGEGAKHGPALDNTPQRDIGAVLRDIRDPSATINPDYVGHEVWLKDSEQFAGFVRINSADAVTLIEITGAEHTFKRGDIKTLRASSSSLMPTGLIDGLKESEVRDILTFLMHEPPKRSASEAAKIPSKPGAPKYGARPIGLVLVASKQDHGPGQHDYPNWQKLWSKTFASENVSISQAWEWPAPEQWAKANVVALYFWNHDWSDARYAELDSFLARGGGLVVFHSATIADREPEKLARRIGLAAMPGPVKYLHTPFTLEFTSKDHPVTFGFPNLELLDEPYWPMIGDAKSVQTLAVAEVDGAKHPLIWTYQPAGTKGRVFVSIPGHYTWTFEDPVFDLLARRAIVWAAGD